MHFKSVKNDSLILLNAYNLDIVAKRWNILGTQFCDKFKMFRETQTGVNEISFWIPKLRACNTVISGLQEVFSSNSLR